MKRPIILGGLTIAVIAFGAGWFARQQTMDRFVISRGTPQSLVFKIDRTTGKTWRYYVNQDGTQGFVETSDWTFEEPK